METDRYSGKFAQQYLVPPAIKPFENIALAFSGGGFRAASFSLGVLSYLNKLKFETETGDLAGHTLLQQVTYLSSASGGTIATTLYALYSAQGKTFSEYYAKVFEILNGDLLLKQSLEILTDKNRWKIRPDKSRNIINAFAMAYDETIFQGETLGSLYYKGTKGHLQEVCFNTTEFYTGQSFRQDTKMVSDTSPIDKFFKFGNEVIYLDHTTAAYLKLGDVLAASSCFPGGFEPILFPKDFTYADVTVDTLKAGLTMLPQRNDQQEKDFIKEKQFGFMDGGIADNQGLQSMMYADGRRIRGETTFKPFDLMMVNDVGSHYMRPYIAPPATKKTGLSLRGSYFIVLACFIIAVAMTTVGVIRSCIPLMIVGAMLITLPLIFLSITWWLKSALFGVSKPSSPLNLKRNFTGAIVKLLVSYFTRTPIVILKQMLLARFDSVLMIMMSVFMKRVRQLLYDKFYGSQQWQNRAKGNHIYDLSFSNDINRNNSEPNPPPYLTPSPDMQKVAEKAFSMPTTLWYDQKEEKQQHMGACIVACGQFTTCYNLLEYIDKLIVNDPICYQNYKTRLDNLKTQLINDMDRFKANPYFCV